MAALQSTVAM